MAKLLRIVIILFLLTHYIQGQNVPENVAAEQQFPNEAISIEQRISFYPNPVDEFLHINLGELDLKNVEFELYNIIGSDMPVDIEKLNRAEFRVNMKEYRSGYYLIVIKDEVKRFNKAYKFQKK
ncbi:MAG TPA: hypothetical protein DDY13_19570 [Cytophagales bacterium]|jgi:hypothetical protein|nr:hypothetical protein [Cytophagales bacterium]